MRGLAYPAAGLLAGFFVLIKFSLGFAAVLTLAAGCLITRRPATALARGGTVLIATGAAALVFWLAAGGPVHGIAAYLRFGWELTRGYSSAMSRDPAHAPTDVALIIVWFVMFIAWVAWERRARVALIAIALAVPLFVAWKHSVVRHDAHVVIIARLGLFFLALLLAESVATHGWRRAAGPIVVMAAPLVLLWTLTDSRYPNWNDRSMRECFVSVQGLRDMRRLVLLPRYRQAIAAVSDAALAETRLPEPMLRRVAGAPVDVYPWNNGFVVVHGLRWHHRPLPASFSTYTPVLDDLNDQFLRSPRRPEFVIWHRPLSHTDRLESIDGRHLFWDEPRTLRTTLSRYEVVDAGDRAILLRARDRERPAAVRPLTSTRVDWNEWVPLPRSDGAMLVAPSLDVTWPLRIVEAVFRSDPLLVTVRLSSGAEHEFRLVPETMSEGIWISPLPITFGELRGFLENGTAPRVVAIRFGTRGLTRGLVPSIHLRWYEAAAPIAPAGR
jgi:hypothetical protein